MPVIQRSIVRALVGCVLTVIVGGCWPTESQLEAGQSVTTGHKAFDGYFLEVAKLRDEVKDFDQELFPIREPLTDELELDADISMSDLLATLQRRAIRFRDFGVLMSLRLNPQPELLTVRGKLEVDPKDERVLAAIEESARRAMKTFRDLRAKLDEAAKLQAKRSSLKEQLRQLGQEDPQYGVIEDELQGAERVLDQARHELLGSCRTLALYLIALADAVDTGAVATKDQECKDAIAGKPPHAPTIPRGPRGPARPVIPVPTKPPSGGGDEFEM